MGASRAVLKQGEWSDWLDVSFDALPGGMLPLTGIVRFYAKELRPGFQVYASPVNISPAAPAQEISTPSKFAPELASFVRLDQMERWQPNRGQFGTAPGNWFVWQMERAGT